MKKKTEKPQYVVSNNTVVGVNFGKETAEAVIAMSKAIEANAQAIRVIAEAFRGDRITTGDGISITQ